MFVHFISEFTGPLMLSGALVGGGAGIFCFLKSLEKKGEVYAADHGLQYPSPRIRYGA